MLEFFIIAYIFNIEVVHIIVVARDNYNNLDYSVLFYHTNFILFLGGTNLSLFSNLKEDYKRFAAPNYSKLQLVRCFLRVPSIWVVTSYRIGRSLHKHKIIKPIGFFWTQFIHLPLEILTGIEIPIKSEFGAGLRIHHYGGIVIHPEVKAGKNVTLFQGVTIGRNINGYDVPKIGDNVVITAGAKIVGGITIGNNVVIGANSVVTKDVPDNCTIAGIPAKVINCEKGSEVYLP